jgi:hypothetical protein
MFNWPLFLVLVLVCVPGVLVTIPNAIQVTVAAAGSLPAGRTLPSRRTILVASLVQTMLLVVLAAAAGTALAPRVGLAAPFFEALVSGGLVWDAFVSQAFPALPLGVGGALILVAAYYLYFRPRLDERTLRHMEGLRMSLGVWARLLYGGIVEEVMFRWGVMTLLVWIGSLLFGSPTPAVVWTVIVISGVLFGLGHVPSYRAAGCQVTPMFLATAIVLNLWATLLCGWLFWQYGLLAAMLAHMLYHLVWLPFDLHLAGRLLSQESQP